MPTPDQLTEETRAAAYRAQWAARLSATKARIVAFSGDPVARQALEDAWAPVRDWMRDPRTLDTDFSPGP